MIGAGGRLPACHEGDEEMSNSDDNEPLSLPQVFASVLASFFGVQKDERRRRDFSRGRPRDFIIVGLVFTLLFILTVWGVVELVLHFALPEG